MGDPPTPNTESNIDKNCSTPFFATETLQDKLVWLLATCANRAFGCRVSLQWPKSTPRSRRTSQAFVMPPHIPQPDLHMFFSPQQTGPWLWILTFDRWCVACWGVKKHDSGLSGSGRREPVREKQALVAAGPPHVGTEPTAAQVGEPTDFMEALPLSGSLRAIAQDY